MTNILTDWALILLAVWLTGRALTALFEWYKAKR